MKRSHGRRCAVAGCLNYQQGSAYSFFRFPTDEERCLKWIAFTLRQDMKEVFLCGMSKRQSHVMCSVHFAACCFMNRDCNKLVHDAVPSLLAYQLQKIQMFPHKLTKPLLIQEQIGRQACNELLEQKLWHESRELEALIRAKQSDLCSEVLISVAHRHGIPAGHTQKCDVSAVQWKKRHSAHDVNCCTVLQAAGCGVIDRVWSLNGEELAETENETISISDDASSHIGVVTTAPERPFSTYEDLNQAADCSKVSTASSSEAGERERRDVREFGQKECVSSDCKGAPLYSSRYYICCAQNCTSISKDISLYSFPDTLNEAMMWLKRACRTELLSMLLYNGSVPDNVLLCEKHFTLDQFVVGAGNNSNNMQNVEKHKGLKRVLKKHALPSIFPSTLTAANDDLKSPCNVKRLPVTKDVQVRLKRLEASTLTPAFCTAASMSLLCGLQCKQQLGVWQQQGTAVVHHEPHALGKQLNNKGWPNSRRRHHKTRHQSAAVKYKRIACKEISAWTERKTSKKQKTIKELKTNKERKRRKERSTKCQHMANVTNTWQKRNKHLQRRTSNKRQLGDSCDQISQCHNDVPLRADTEENSSSDEGILSKKQPAKRCVYSHCSHTSPSLHMFPKEVNRCLTWIENLQSAALLSEYARYGARYVAHRHSLCALHFEGSCFYNLTHRARLVSYAVPTLFSGPMDREHEIKHPCQHESLPRQYRNCSHQRCQALAHQGSYVDNAGTQAASVTPQVESVGGGLNPTVPESDSIAPEVEDLSINVSTGDNAPLITGVHHNNNVRTVLNQLGSEVQFLGSKKRWTLFSNNVQAIQSRSVLRDLKLSNKLDRSIKLSNKNVKDSDCRGERVCLSDTLTSTVSHIKLNLVIKSEDDNGHFVENFDGKVSCYRQKCDSFAAAQVYSSRPLVLSEELDTEGSLGNGGQNSLSSIAIVNSREASLPNRLSLYSRSPLYLAETRQPNLPVSQSCLDKLAELDEEDVRLRAECRVMSYEVDRQRSQLYRTVKRIEQLRDAPLTFTVYDALNYCQERLPPAASLFFQRQLKKREPQPRMQWSITSAVLPLLMNRCGPAVWPVLATIYTLPYKDALMRFRKIARTNPLALKNISVLRSFVGTNYPVRFYRKSSKAAYKHKGRKCSSVSDVIQKFIDRN